MVTAENARLNLRTAARNVAERLGVDPANMDQAQRIAYNRALAAEILKYPQSFTPEIIEIAQRIGYTDSANLEDASFSWGEFAAEAISPAAEAAQSIGQGALNVANLSRWLIPAAVIFFVFLWISNHAGRPPAASA